MSQIFSDFFFQAEDGIRDKLVTGVQTCALPILRAYRAPPLESSELRVYDRAPMPLTSGKQAFLEILAQEGVSVMFGNPGTTELPLMDGLAREPRIRYVLALQEAVAIAMADGYALASGGLAAGNVHIAPGLGNAMGMLYNARKSGAPLPLTARQPHQSFTATEPIPWAPLPPVAAPLLQRSTQGRRPRAL